MVALDTVIEPEKVKAKDEAVSNFVTSIHSDNVKMSQEALKKALKLETDKQSLSAFLDQLFSLNQSYLIKEKQVHYEDVVSALQLTKDASAEYLRQQSDSNKQQQDLDDLSYTNAKRQIVVFIEGLLAKTEDLKSLHQQDTFMNQLYQGLDLKRTKSLENQQSKLNQEI